MIFTNTNTLSPYIFHRNHRWPFATTNKLSPFMFYSIRSKFMWESAAIIKMNLFSEIISRRLFWPNHDVDLDSFFGFVQKDFAQSSTIDGFVDAAKQSETWWFEKEKVLLCFYFYVSFIIIQKESYKFCKL